MKHFAAHTPREAGGEWHLLSEHLQATAELARERAEKFAAGDLAYLAGLLHDLGKYNPQFQKYLRDAHEGREAVSAPHAELWQMRRTGLQDRTIVVRVLSAKGNISAAHRAAEGGKAGIRFPLSSRRLHEEGRLLDQRQHREKCVHRDCRRVKRTDREEGDAKR